MQNGLSFFKVIFRPQKRSDLTSPVDTDIKTKAPQPKSTGLDTNRDLQY